MKLPLHRVAHTELPWEAQAWLDGSRPLPPEVTWLRPRYASPVALVVAFGILFAFTALVAAGLGLQGDPSGLVFLVVGAVPFAVMLGLVRSQRRARRAFEQGTTRLGVLYGPRHLVYAPDLATCTVFERDRLEPIVECRPMSGRRGQRAVRLVQEVPEAQRRALVELWDDELQFPGDAAALAAHLEAWRQSSTVAQRP